MKTLYALIIIYGIGWMGTLLGYSEVKPKPPAFIALFAATVWPMWFWASVVTALETHVRKLKDE